MVHRGIVPWGEHPERSVFPASENPVAGGGRGPGFGHHRVPTSAGKHFHGCDIDLALAAGPGKEAPRPQGAFIPNREYRLIQNGGRPPSPAMTNLNRHAGLTGGDIHWQIPPTP